MWLRSCIFTLLLLRCGEGAATPAVAKAVGELAVSFIGLIPGGSIALKTLQIMGLAADLYGGYNSLTDDGNDLTAQSVAKLSNKVDEVYAGITNKIDQLEYTLLIDSFNKTIASKILNAEQLLKNLLNKTYARTAVDRIQLRNVFLNSFQNGQAYAYASKILVHLKGNALQNALIQSDDFYCGGRSQFKNFRNNIEQYLEKLKMIDIFAFGLRNLTITQQLSTNLTMQKNFLSLTLEGRQKWWIAKFEQLYSNNLLTECAAIENFLTDYELQHSRTNKYWSRDCVKNIVTSVRKNYSSFPMEERVKRIIGHLSNIYTIDNMYVFATNSTVYTGFNRTANVTQTLENGETIMVFRKTPPFTRTVLIDAIYSKYFASITACNCACPLEQVGFDSLRFSAKVYEPARGRPQFAQGWTNTSQFPAQTYVGYFAFKPQPPNTPFATISWCDNTIPMLLLAFYEP